MTSRKECAILQSELEGTKEKLASIENNSFGSNDMVIALKQQLDDVEQVKEEQQLQISQLEKELEAAAEAGLELNRMVSDLLSNQSGSDSILSTVEELQKELNEQESKIFVYLLKLQYLLIQIFWTETIVSINSLLADKSRENSELQVAIAEQKTAFDEQIAEIQSAYNELEEKNSSLEDEITQIRSNVELKLNDVIQAKSIELERQSHEMEILQQQINEITKQLKKTESKNQFLDESLKKLKGKSGSDKEMRETLDAINLKAELIAVTKENESLNEKLEGEMDEKKLLKTRVNAISDELSTLKQEYSNSEKDKVEAQTRLEVLSGYFKEKETQLQK